MPLLSPLTTSVLTVGTQTMITEGQLITPKIIILSYVEIAKACYVSTGSKRIACGVALIPGLYQLLLSLLVLPPLEALTNYKLKA